MLSKRLPFLRRAAALCSSARPKPASPAAVAPPPPTAPPGVEGFTDIDDAWAKRLLPAWLVPYSALARWDRPIGTYLLLWPCLWSTALAAPAGGPPDAMLCLLFGVGSFAMRGAGCTANDLWDRDIDRRVERTRHRPLASGAVGVRGALGFLAAQCGVGLGVLAALPTHSVVLGLASTPLWTLYPLAKRYTNWPQAVLGLTFNWGALMGWSAVHGSCDWLAVLPLYASGFWWTMLYDTVYAHQDKREDAQLGVGSTALRLAKHTKPWLAGFGVATMGCLGLAGAAVDMPPLYYAGLACGAAHLSWQVWSLDLDSRADCLSKFRSNHHFGALVFAAIVAGKLYSSSL
ncbi:hypothetical protein AB1Y20_015117 [Prymnesium parvum]|uniref:4-hydroxybenzoate polyprenyltransferase, mitochondrial n=1 Tax=Prymnesium parvum TaxID=97485 RepID=A0AB34K1L4_PRYPA